MWAWHRVQGEGVKVNKQYPPSFHPHANPVAAIEDKVWHYVQLKVG